MGCSTFFFDSSQSLDEAIALLRREGVEAERFAPSPSDPIIRVWAASVEGAVASRTKEILVSADMTPIGYYDLPQAERALPQEEVSGDPTRADAPFIGKMWIAYAAQCFADPAKIRLIAHHDMDSGPLMPYLNAIIKPAQYNPGAPTLSFKNGVRMITLYPGKIAIAKADDLLDAWLYLKQIKDRLDDVNSRRDEIAPDFSKSEPPSPLDIYKLLPKTNCGECGTPTCLAFAALLAGGEAGPDSCPFLKESEFADRRFRLFELLGEAP
jgi:ArsR family metal-binding transcriptional regulator